MCTMEEVKKTVYESYKWLYKEAVDNMKTCLGYAKEYKKMGRLGWAAEWLEKANDSYKMAKRYKRSMERWAA